MIVKYFNTNFKNINNNQNIDQNILSIIKYYRSLDEEKQKDGGAE